MVNKERESRLWFVLRDKAYIPRDDNYKQDNELVDKTEGNDLVGGKFLEIVMSLRAWTQCYENFQYLGKHFEFDERKLGTCLLA